MSRGPRFDEPRRLLAIWRGLKSHGGTNAVVFQDPEGGLRFRYRAHMHADSPWCQFSLYCEVGERYQPAFMEFMIRFALAEEPLSYGHHRPYMADRIAKPGEKVSVWSEPYHTPKLRKMTSEESQYCDASERSEYPLWVLELPGSKLNFEKGKHTWFVLDIETKPAYQRQGRATRLILEFKELADAAGAHIEWGAFTPDGAQYIEKYTK